MMQTYMYHDKSHLQQAAMGAVDMGMAMRQAAVGVLPAAAGEAVVVGVRQEAAVGSSLLVPSFSVSLSIS